jgi:predicted nucleotidyltransferase
MTSGLRKTLKFFFDAKIDFILVGGLSAVVRGAPVNTYDVDIVHARNSQNIERLLPLLKEIDAIFRIQPHRRLRPNESHLSGRGHINLATTFGPLDLLCTIGNDLTYEDLLSHSDELELGDGLKVRVLKLEKLIELKEQLNSDKDRAMLPLLRRTLEEIRKSGR